MSQLRHENLVTEDFLYSLFRFPSSYQKLFEAFLSKLPYTEYLLCIKDPKNDSFDRHKITTNPLTFENEKNIYYELNTLILFSELEEDNFYSSIMLYPYKYI